MNKLKFFGLLMLGALIFSSCSKQKYTASFAPSKQKRWVKLETPTASQSNEDDALASVSTVAPAPSLNVKTESKDISLNNEEASAPIISQAESKVIRKKLKKEVFKHAAKKVFHKKSNARPQTESHLLYIILALFPVLCLLGIYLYQGEQITNDFWLDLLLHITVFGEIIYALLVVLGAISIA